MENLTDINRVLDLFIQVKEEKQLSLDKIKDMLEGNGCFISKSTLSRVFSKKERTGTFNYETTIRPIAEVLLDFDIEQDDDTDTKAYKSMLKLKKDLIEDYASQNKELKEENRIIKEKERARYTEKLQKQTEEFQQTLQFVNRQIELKDQRIDTLLKTTTELMALNNQLVKQLMNCPFAKEIHEH